MLFPIFVVMTLLEIYVLVTVGQAIGGFSNCATRYCDCTDWLDPFKATGLVNDGKGSTEHS